MPALYSAAPIRMTMPMDAAKTQALIAAGQLFHQRGWVPASGGNFSYRVDAAHMAITASGCHKGELQPDDLILADLDGRPIDTPRKASAETLLHCQIYRQDAAAGAVFHTHSVASTRLSRSRDSLPLAGYELLKILEGIETHQTVVEVPVFENDQDIGRLAQVVDAAMRAGRARHGYLIRGHGLYAWAPTVALARYRIEALEFMFQCELGSAH